MPHRFRTLDGTEKRASQALPLWLADGTKVEGIWGGSATEERLDWWLGKRGHEITQSEGISEVAVRDDDTKKIRLGAAPAGAKLLFVLKPPTAGKNGDTYRMASMVTTAATPAQIACFRDNRFALFGTLNPDGTIERIPPLEPPPPDPPAQGELF